MAEAKIDVNNVPTLIGLLNTDGETTTNLEADPTSHAMQMDNDTTGSDSGGDHALRDDNHKTSMIAVDETDGSTPVALYVNSDGELLVDST